MTPEEIIRELKRERPWVCDPEAGVYCFFCGCEYQDSFQGGIFEHEKDCLWLKIEAIKLD